MTQEPQRSWLELLCNIKKHLEDAASRSTFDWALANYVLNAHGAALELPPCDTDAFLKAFTPIATHTATLGLLLASGIAQDAKDRFLEGVERCAKQTAPAAGPSVHTDPKLLLGIAASHALLPEEHRKWLGNRLSELALSKDLVTTLSANLAANLLDPKAAAKSLEGFLRKAEPRTPQENVLALMNLSAGQSNFSEVSRADLERIRRVAREGLYELDVTITDALIASGAHVILTQLLRNALGDLEQTAVERLLGMLKRLPIAAKKDKQAPENEYDIQRLLWTLLAGDYPDLQDEAWLKQFGVYHPRADLAIESLKAIIEAKYIRKAGQFRETQDQIVADAKTYTQDPSRFEKVIAVIYDASSSVHEHEKLATALKKVDGVVDVIIFPGFNPKPTKRK